MRILNTKTYQFEEFDTADVPRYAILSHTWGKDEVSFKDMEHGPSSLVRAKAGFRKIELTCLQAQVDKPSLDYAWIDTCCIDKSSSAELSEAINSMFRWYASAEICYAYISDFKASRGRDMRTPQFFQSRWWERGWTLQELIAPKKVIFYDHDWKIGASKTQLAFDIARFTPIPASILRHEESLEDYSVAKRMSWASTRKTTRVEDLAYCLLGIFDVNMSLIYGEGAKSFLRLQEEILRRTDDQSIFAWKIPDAESDTPSGLFAQSPLAFKYSRYIKSFRNWTQLSTATTTSSGLSISLPLTREFGHRVEARLNCSLQFEQDDQVTITLTRIPGSRECYARVSTNQLGSSSIDDDDTFQARQVHVLQKPPRPKPGDVSLLYSFQLTAIPRGDHKCNHLQFLTSNMRALPWGQGFIQSPALLAEHLSQYQFQFRPYSGKPVGCTIVYKHLPRNAQESPGVAKKQDNVYFLISIRAGGRSGDIEVACGSFEHVDDGIGLERLSVYVSATYKHQGILHKGTLQLIDTRTRTYVWVQSSVDQTGCNYAINLTLRERGIHSKTETRG